jgi:hypothetical protein
MRDWHLRSNGFRENGNNVSLRSFFFGQSPLNQIKNPYDKVGDVHEKG